MGDGVDDMVPVTEQSNPITRDIDQMDSQGRNIKLVTKVLQNKPLNQKLIIVIIIVLQVIL